MSEGNPEKGRPIDFLERHIKKINSKKRTELGVSAEGDMQYPEQKLEITAEQALAVARDVVETTDVKTLDAEALARQREYVQYTSHESLLKILELHEKSPNYFGKEYILAVSETFVSKFG